MARVSRELRLRPNKKQQRRLCETLNICMNLWNLLMERAIAIFMETIKAPTAIDLNRDVNAAWNILVAGRATRPQSHETRG